MGGAWVILAAAAGVTVGNLGAAWLRYRYDVRSRCELTRFLEDQRRRQRH